MAPDDTVDAALIDEVRGLRGDVRDLNRTVADERAGRKQTTRLAAAVAIVGFIVIGGLGINWIRDGRITCAERTRSRVELRAAIGVAVDEGARELGASDEQRVDVRDNVNAAVLDAYPPPDC